MPEFGFIGGSGLYDLPGLEKIDEVEVDTPYGKPSGSYRVGKLGGREIIFLARHGSGHTIPPHRINYRANIWGFRHLGVSRLLSVFAAGGISADIKPGDIVVPDQIIDVTGGRASTFFDEQEVVHIDFTEPFCPDLREQVAGAAERSGIPIARKGTYICVNGPRLETAAEIRAYSVLGADLVGMTAMPEACLAREAEICYAGLSIVTNYAAGISGRKLTVSEVKETMASSEVRIRTILEGLMRTDIRPPSCLCRETLSRGRM
ncbi:MAG: S-methyl-5'-thioadenosine phosphorylase [Nitrospirae bacterium]|nr:S-methyl-5'-thioadenosine phosphorylase [Nitrospirota bacterium]